MESFVFVYALVFGSIFVTSVESAVKITNPYNGKVLSGLLNTSVSFSWTVSGDIDSVAWGLKSSDTVDVNVTLVSLEKAGPVSVSIPSSYVGRVSGEWDNSISPGEATFTLTSIELEDSAFYACRISPSDFSDDVNDFVELVVKDPPKAFPEEQVKSADAGESVTFVVHTSGTPPPNITWYRNGLQVSGSQYVGANSSQLTIKNASPADHGYFDCQVTSSGLKPAAARFFLGVLKFQEDKVLCPKTNYEADIGDKVVLCCPVSGYPPPEVEWTFGGMKINNSLATVLVRHVKENDYGSYICTARSLKGAIGPFTINISKTEVSIIKDVTNKTELKPGDKFEWTAVPGAKDYLIIITGVKVENSSLLGNGTSLEIHYSSLTLKNTDNKGDPLVINIRVLAIGNSTVKGKGGPFVKKILSAATAPKGFFLPVILLFVMAVNLQ